MANIDYNQWLKFILDPDIKQADKNRLYAKYPDHANRYLRTQLKAEGRTPGSGTKQQPKQSTPKAQVKPNLMEQRMTKEGLTKAATKGASVGSKAKNIIGNTAKAGAKAAGGLIAGALDLPTTVHNWMDEGANTLSRGLDVAGTALTTASPYALKIPGWRGKVAGATMLGLGQGAHILSDKVRSDNVSQQPLVNPLTPEEQERYNQNIINDANNLQAQAKNQLQQTQDAIDWYNAVDSRITNKYNKVNQEIADYNMSLPAAPKTGLNYNSGTSNPPSNLTQINEPPTSANNNQPIITNQGNNPMVNQQPTNTQPTNNDIVNLINNIKMLNSYIGGVQQGNTLPNLSVSNEELQAYTNALEQMGRQAANANRNLDLYMQGMAQVNKANRMAPVLNALGSAAGNLLDTRYRPMFDVTGRHYIGDRTGALDDPYVSNMGGNAAQGAMNDLNNLNAMFKLREAQENRTAENATRFADLLTAARVSNATGLPLNVTRNMTPEDYLNYIKPTQSAQNRAQELAIEGTQDLITNRQQQLADYARALDVQALQNRGQLTNQQLQQLGQYQRELLSQNAANQRAQLDALVQTRVAELNNNTKLQLMQMTGMNAQQLERLRQSDPNAYLRAVGNVLMATTYSTTPQARQIENILFNNILNDIQPGQTSGTRQPASQSYWAQFNE